jgi:hypothetical protein
MDYGDRGDTPTPEPVAARLLVRFPRAVAAHCKVYNDYLAERFLPYRDRRPAYLRSRSSSFTVSFNSKAASYRGTLERPNS